MNKRILPCIILKTTPWLLLFVLNSCISGTKYTSSPGGCPRAFVTGKKVLMGEIAGISSNQSYEQYEELKEQFTEAGLQADYIVEQEMDIRMHGVRPGEETDSSGLTILHGLGYDYFLQISVNGLKAGAGYNRVSADDKRQIQNGYAALTEDDTKAIVRFELYSTQKKRVVYTLDAATKMSGITIPDRDTQEGGYRGKTTFNLSSITMAVDKAFKKGTKNFLKECQ